jgi:hypothetical protein
VLATARGTTTDATRQQGYSGAGFTNKLRDLAIQLSGLELAPFNYAPPEGCWWGYPSNLAPDRRQPGHSR